MQFDIDIKKNECVERYQCKNLNNTCQLLCLYEFCMHIKYFSEREREKRNAFVYLKVILMHACIWVMRREKDKMHW